MKAESNVNPPRHSSETTQGKRNSCSSLAPPFCLSGVVSCRGRMVRMQRVFGAAARRSLSLLNTNKKKLPHPPPPSAPSFSTASTSFLFDDTQLQVFFCSFLIIVVVVVYLLLCLLNDLLFLSFPQFKESVSQFAQENIAPHASTIDQSNYFPKVI